LANENRVKQKETEYHRRKDELSRSIRDFEVEKKEVEVIRENLTHQLELVEQKSEEVEKLHRQEVEKLEIISGFSADEAKAQLVESLKNDAKAEAMSYIQEIMDEAKLNANKEAKKIIVKIYSTRCF
jgi:ribonuclease Y